MVVEDQIKRSVFAQVGNEVLYPFLEFFLIDILALAKVVPLIVSVRKLGLQREQIFTSLLLATYVLR